MFIPATVFVEGVDFAFKFIIGVGAFFLIAITGVIIYFLFKYNKKKNPVADTSIEGSNKLEIIWTVIPTILVLMMFYFGWVAFDPMRDIPADSFSVKVTGRMWSWTFEYPNGKKSEKLIVPVDRNIKLELNSMDVNHAFYIPAFRIKEDVIPGRINKMWFNSDELGSFDVFCAEYCGLRHANMLTTVEVVTKEKFDEWYKLAPGDSDLDKVSAGFELVKASGCVACHSTDGTKLVADSFKDIWGKTHTVITDGKERQIVVDAEYIKKSIYEPNHDVLKGYKAGLMPKYQNQIKDDEVDKIIEYIKSLGISN